MSGSQHNPNGRQSQLGPGWSPLQLQMANLLARAPQAHMASDRGVTWHTPTPPPHLYHVPAPSPPDPLQAMKGAGGNSVFRHTATPPELYRHTPTPPDKHMMRHTPSPGDVKTGPPIPPDLYQHLGPARDKLVREELLAYARGVDLSLGSRANGAAPPAHPPHSPALSVRDAPTINSLIARSGARRVDSLLERLSAAPASPHSVIVHPRVPSPPSSNEDSLDSCGAPTGSKRKRKPERTVRVPAPPPPAPPPLVSEPLPTPTTAVGPASPPPETPRLSPPAENGVTHAELDRPPPTEPAAPPPPPVDDAKGNEGETGRRKTRSGSAETIADIAAMIADGGGGEAPPAPLPPAAPALSVDKLKSVLASPEPAPPPEEPRPVDMEVDGDLTPVSAQQEGAGCVAPRRLGSGGAPESPAEPKPAEGATAEPCSFVEVENQLEKMFAGLEEPRDTVKESAPASKRRKSGPGRGRDAPTRRKGARKKQEAKPRKEVKDPPPVKEVKEGYDSGSNASSGRSRGPYIQIRGPRASPVSVCVMNAATGEEEERGARRARGERGERRRGLHASTLGLRYDAATRDASWLCAFCQRGPHARALGDLFGPYPLDTDLSEYRALDEPARRRYSADGRHEAWLHADCGVWAPGVVAAGARIWGLARAVWTTAAERCRHCSKASGPVACAARGCLARAHLPCARAAAWRLDETDFRAMCPLHRPDPV